MRQVVLADTGPLYAAVDPTDHYHLQAQRELAKLQRERLTVGVAYSTLIESYTLVLRRVGLQTAHGWLEEIQSGVVLINPTPDDYLAVASRIRAYSDQPLTMFDGVLVVLSKRLGLSVWTYDYHFDLMRANVWR